MRTYRLVILLFLAACKATAPSSSSGGYSEDLSVHRPQAEISSENTDIQQETRTEEYVPLRGHIQEELDSINAQVETCLAEREAAQNAVGAAESRAVPRVLSPAEDARVEELANPEASGRKARRSTDEDHGELQALLGKVGQTSYLDYVMYRLSPTPAPEAIATALGFGQPSRGATTRM